MAALEKRFTKTNLKKNRRSCSLSDVLAAFRLFGESIFVKRK